MDVHINTFSLIVNIFEEYNYVNITLNLKFSVGGVYIRIFKS